VEPTFSLELPSSELEAPQLLEDEDEEPELEEEAPHVEPSSRRYCSRAPHVELELSVLVFAGVLRARGAAVGSRFVVCVRVCVSTHRVVVYGGLEVVDVTPAA